MASSLPVTADRGVDPTELRRRPRPPHLWTIWTNLGRPRATAASEVDPLRWNVDWARSDANAADVRSRSRNCAALKAWIDFQIESTGNLQL